MDDISIYSWNDYPDDWVRKNSNLNQVVLQKLVRLRDQCGSRQIFELGCGNGSFADMADRSDFEIVGVDPSPEAIRKAKRVYPHLNLVVGSSEEDLVERFGRFPLVVSLEVIEHVFDPKSFAMTIFNLLEPGGNAIVSTPYHGYIKNLVLALTGQMDRHFTALWSGGHIKFFSVKTLRALLLEAGFMQPIGIQRVGRIAPLAKTMVAVISRPS